MCYNFNYIVVSTKNCYCSSYLLSSPLASSSSFSSALSCFCRFFSFFDTRFSASTFFLFALSSCSAAASNLQCWVRSSNFGIVNHNFIIPQKESIHYLGTYESLSASMQSMASGWQLNSRDLIILPIRVTIVRDISPFLSPRNVLWESFQ